MVSLIRSSRREQTYLQRLPQCDIGDKPEALNLPLPKKHVDAIPKCLCTRLRAVESGYRMKIEWMAEALADMKTFAELNGLTELQKQLTVCQELAVKAQAEKNSNKRNADM